VPKQKKPRRILDFAGADFSIFQMSLEISPPRRMMDSLLLLTLLDLGIPKLC
jgi:hypothetical protein